MKKYDNIISTGCSFVLGANIQDSNDNWVGEKYRFSKLLSDHYSAKEYNDSVPGSGNERILNTIFNTYQELKSQKNLFIIGLSGITRELFFTNNREEYFDIHAHDLLDEEVRFKKLGTKLFGSDYDIEWIKKWRYLNLKYFYNYNEARTILQRNILFLDGFFKSRNIDYILFNSISDDIDEIKKDINYLSFDIKDGKSYPKTDHTKTNSSKEDDTWYHYLRLRQEEINPDFNNKVYRSSKPEYGEWFCGGHPSPNANKDLADKLIKKINVL